MKDNMLRKGLVYTIIAFLVGVSIIPVISGSMITSYTISFGDEFIDKEVCGIEDGGILDIAVANYDSVSVLKGDGHGGFGNRQDYNTGEGQADIVAEDFDKDGNLDLATTNYMDNNITILFGDGFGNFGDQQDYLVGDGPSDIVAADFNGDTSIDLAITNSADLDTLTLLFGDGSGGFGDRHDYFVGYWPSSIITGYFDGDSNLDLIVSNYPLNTISIIFGDGSGGFGFLQSFS